MRWRRLSEKIEKEGAGVKSAATTPKPSAPKKRKAVTPIDEESDSEEGAKKIKSEDAGAVPDKRETRGKTLDYKGLFDSGSSISGATTTTTTSGSNFEVSAVDEEDDDADVEEDSMVSSVNPDIKTPAGKTVATKANFPPTPQSGAPSSVSTPNPAATRNPTFADGPPTPVTPGGFNEVLPSIEADDPQVNARRSKRASLNSSISSKSGVYESASEGPSQTSSVLGRVASDLSSLTPDDSVSMVGTWADQKQERARKANQVKGDGLFGKFWGYWGRG
jgi:hypothetical protein